VLLARVHLREQHAAEAIEEARVAARLDPRSSDALRWLALALAGAGRFSEAGEQFTRWERLAADEVPATDRDTMRAARAAATLLAQLLGGAHG
jgi:Flp pilus assembly protein TadD